MDDLNALEYGLRTPHFGTNLSAVLLEACLPTLCNKKYQTDGWKNSGGKG